MKINAQLLLLTVVLAGPVWAAKPQIQWNPDYDFSTVRTFQWQATPADTFADSDPFLHSRIVNAIEYELTQYNLTEVQSDPDVYVTYHGSSRTDVSLRSTSVGYSFGRYGRGGWGYYGYGMGGPVMTTTDVVELERGTLMVDIWEADSDELIWRGVASDIVISDNPNKTQKNAVKAIEKMAKQYRKLRARER